MKNIAIFVSGSGSNAEKIAEWFSHSDVARVALIVSDNPEAYALQRAARLGIESVVVPRSSLRDGSGSAARLMKDKGVDYIVLAGFLSLVPSDLIAAYPGRIVNIHPALLPAYGGKGMYGARVHRAVIENGEKQSGITIHHVTEKYDDGAIVAQFRVDVAPDDTPESLAAKIHTLEHAHYPRVIEEEIRRME